MELDVVASGLAQCVSTPSALVRSFNGSLESGEELFQGGIESVAEASWFASCKHETISK